MEPVCCSMSSSNCCFLTCIQISQEAGQVVWYSQLFQNFPVCCDLHRKGFGVINKAEDVFLKFSLAFSMIQWMLAIWSLVPLPFLNSALTSGNSQFTYCWNLAWRILSITLLACEMSAIVWLFEYSLALPFFGIGMKTDLFQFYGHCRVFQICWHIECRTFTASSFRIWNSSTGIPSPPLVLLIMMLPKAPLTSHARMSGSRWVITPSWLSGSWRSFLYSSVYSCYLFLIASASEVHTISVLYCAHLCMKYPLGISKFLEEIFSLSHSIVFLCFSALITEEGFLISPCYSLKLCIQMGISFLFSFAFRFSSFHSYF